MSRYRSGGNLALTVYKYSGDKSKLWGRFRDYHYLSKSLNSSASVYICALDGIIVGFCGILVQPSGTMRNAYRVSRLVILPDFQGMGIGKKFLEFVMELYIKDGKKIYLKTAHRKMKTVFDNSSKWIASGQNEKMPGINQGIAGFNKSLRNGIAFNYEFVGDRYNFPHVELYIDYTPEIDIELLRRDINLLSSAGYYVIIATGSATDKNPIEKMCLDDGIRSEILYYKGKLCKKAEKKKVYNKYTENESKELMAKYDIRN